MKILIINWQDIKNPFGGGAEVHLHEIFRRIAAMGHSVTLYCCRFEGSSEEEEIDGIRVIREGSRNLFNFYVKKRYLRQFANEDHDIVIDDINKIPFYTPRYVKKPLLAISHHFFGKSIFREAGLIQGAYVYLSEKLVDRYYKSTPFAVVSESTRQEFIERGFPPHIFSIVQNAITQAEFPLSVGEKTEYPSVVYFGRLKKYKSVDHLVRAFAQIYPKYPDAKLEFIGRGNFLPYLEKLAAKLGIRNNTIFHGFVSEEEKKKLLSRSWLVVNTSMKEGWGITNIEANACGTPVVSADVPGLRDSIKDGVSGIMYEYGNIEQLTAQLEKIISNHEYRTELSQGAVSWAKTFDWSDSARLMLEKCEEVIRDYNGEGRNLS